MIRILICCLGGFSSSTMVKKIKNEIIENNLEDKMCVEFSPFACAYELIHDYDVIMVCPHTRYEAGQFVKKHDDLDIPIYVLPFRMYGHMTAPEIYLDAEDIVKGYKESKFNPWHFQGEENALTIKRVCSHRNYKKTV